MSEHSWKLLIMRDGTSAQRVVKINRVKISLVMFLSIALLLALTFTISHFLTQRLTADALATAEEENSELRQKLQSMTYRVDSIKVCLTEIYEKDDELRIMADLPKIDDDTRQVGIGGSVEPEEIALRDDGAIDDLIFDLDKIEREIELQQKSFSEIRSKFVKNADLIAHTPSLRPVDGGYVSSRYGWRKDPFTGRRAHHNGLDICVERGTPVYATANGKVVLAKRCPGFGKMIIIDHGYDFRTVYGHLDRILVNYGQTIERGQKIGEVGNTGRSTGPHIHYEVQVNRKAVDPVDYIFDNFSANG